MDRYATLRNGLIGAWCPSLRTGGYTLEDRGRWRNDGTLTNAPTWSAGALSLTAASKHYVSLPNSALFNRLTSGEMSLTAWINPTTVSGTQVVCGNVTAAGSNATFSLEFGRTASKVTLIHNGSIAATSSATLTANKWQFVGFARSGASGAWTIRLITDGVVDSSSTGVNPSSAPGTVSVGRAGDYDGLYMGGLIDDVRLWNRPISNSEIALLATRRGVGLIPQRRRHAKVGSQFYIRDSGTWKTATPWIKVGGVWKQATPSLNVTGTWK